MQDSHRTARDRAHRSGPARAWRSRSCRLRPRIARRRTSRGAVTAETVLVLPVLVALTLALAWMLALAVGQVRAVDAAREVARAVARDEPRGAALALGRRVAPAGSSISIRDEGDALVVQVVTEVRGPGGLLRRLPGVSLSAEAVAAKEQS